MAKKKDENELLQEHTPPNTGGDTPQEPSEPKNGNTFTPPPNGKKRIRNESLKNESVIVFDGTAIPFDENGTAEIEDKYATYLLQIPSYSEVTA